MFGSTESLGLVSVSARCVFDLSDLSALSRARGGESASLLVFGSTESSGLVSVSARCARGLSDPVSRRKKVEK